jgi:TPP-dependent 2-oxoacid decarboxylase
MYKHSISSPPKALLQIIEEATTVLIKGKLTAPTEMTSKTRIVELTLILNLNKNYVSIGEKGFCQETLTKMKSNLMHNIWSRNLHQKRHKTHTTPILFQRRKVE